MMRFVSLLCLIFFSGSWSFPGDPNLNLQRFTAYPYWSGNFRQVLDHSDKYVRMFSQRYWSSAHHWDRNTGPIFLSISGEYSDDSPFTGSMLTELAPHFRALCFELEHRFYGDSSPFYLNGSSPGLMYNFLSSEQAIDDIIYFILQMNKVYNLEGKKWIVFGGSYAGSLAAWVRQKRPDLIFAAVSHSAPLEAIAELQLPKEYCLEKEGYPGLKGWRNLDIDRAWHYQICSEFGWLNADHCDSSTLEEHEQLLTNFCQNEFGPEFNLERIRQGIKKTNLEYGGKTYNVSHTMFVHGSLDTWRFYGIEESNDPLMPAWVVEGAGHCDSMRSNNKLETFSMSRTVYLEIQKSKRKIMAYLEQWLQEETYGMYGY